MYSASNSSYKGDLRKRLKVLVDSTGLTTVGFSLLINTSESHIYAILNGSRRLTVNLAELIGNKLNFEGGNIFDLTYELPTNFKKNKELNNFYTNYSKTNPEYFLISLTDRKKSKYVEQLIETTTILDTPKYLSQIRSEINSVSLTHKFNSDDLSKILNYLADNKKLSKIKRPIMLKSSNKLGKRVVDVFCKDNDLLNQ